MKLSAIIALTLSLSAIARPLANPEPYAGGITNDLPLPDERGKVPTNSNLQRIVKLLYERQAVAQAELTKTQGNRAAVRYWQQAAAVPEESLRRERVFAEADLDFKIAQATLQVIAEELEKNQAGG